jgi:hypothetical protein
LDDHGQFAGFRVRTVAVGVEDRDVQLREAVGEVADVGDGDGALWGGRAVGEQGDHGLELGDEVVVDAADVGVLF